MPIPLPNDDSPHGDDDPHLFHRLTCDICFLYHELADYGGLMGDLDYATYFPLDYWRFLNRIDDRFLHSRFVRSGILVLMLNMVDELFCGGGTWILRHVDIALEELSSFVPEDEDAARLCDSVVYALSLAKQGHREDDRFRNNAGWAYNRFVRGYFLERGN